MAFVAVATTVGATVLGTGAAAGIGSTIVGGALIGAGIGGLYSAFTGDGNILNSMLTGGLIGGAGAGIGGTMFPGAAGITPAAAAAPSTAALPTSNVMTTTAAQKAAAANLTAASTPAQIEAAVSGMGVLGEGAASLPGVGLTAAPEVITPQLMAATGAGGTASTAAGLTGKQMLGYGLAGTAAMQLLGGRSKGANAPASATDPGSIRPYQYTSTPNTPTGTYPAPFATASYDAAGNPVLDTRERDYFTQAYTPLEPYSARVGTPNPNPVRAAIGGLMGAGGPVERMSTRDMTYEGPGMVPYGMFPQGQIERTVYATPTQRPASMEIVNADYDTGVNPMTGLPPVRMSNGGDIDLEEERRKLIMKNIKGASTKELEKTLGALNEQEFLRRNMPEYAESMRPSINSMIEGAQLNDRMAQSYGAQPKDITVMPTTFDPKNKTYGGIAAIGQNIDPQTRMNLMANLQSTPYDRSSMDMVRRVGAGIDRQIGRDANLSAFYEQDPMGRNKMGGARYTQRFDNGGLTSFQGYQGYGQSNTPNAPRSNPIGEFLIGELAPKATPTVNVASGNSQSPAAVSTEDSREQNPILRGMYQKMLGTPDYQFTKPELIAGYQAYNPNAFAYSPTAQNYQAATPNDEQLEMFKQQMANYMEQDRAKRAQAQQEQQAASGAAQGGLMSMAMGGSTGYNLGGYSDGGRLLKGPGDGMSDHIPATIGKRQPARLADGEFVVPADVVSHLGNGSTDAGAKRLYAMMDNVRKARTGNKKQGKQIKAQKYLPA